MKRVCCNFFNQFAIVANYCTRGKNLRTHHASDVSHLMRGIFYWKLEEMTPSRRVSPRSLITKEPVSCRKTSFLHFTKIRADPYRTYVTPATLIQTSFVKTLTLDVPLSPDFPDWSFKCICRGVCATWQMKKRSRKQILRRHWKDLWENSRSILP